MVARTHELPAVLPPPVAVEFFAYNLDNDNPIDIHVTVFSQSFRSRIDVNCRAAELVQKVLPDL